MRRAYTNVFNDIENLSQHKDLFNIPPQSAQ